MCSEKNNNGGQQVVQLVAAFNGGAGKKAMGIGYEIQTSPTLRANSNAPTVLIAYARR